MVAWLGAVLLALAVVWGTASPASADGQWQEVAKRVTSLIQEVPALYATGDVKAVESTIRKAYYEEYQASGLEDEIKHRLGADRSSAFSKGVVELRNLARDGAPQSEVDDQTGRLVTRLETDVADLESADSGADLGDHTGQVVAQREG